MTGDEGLLCEVFMKSFARPLNINAEVFCLIQFGTDCVNANPQSKNIYSDGRYFHK